MNFTGVHTALVTPFNESGDFDAAAYRSLIDSNFDNGVAGIVPVGTTGESPTLNNAEHLEVIKTAIDATAGRGLVIAGTGSNSTREAITMTQHAEEAGASASLQVCPYYNRPSQEGLFEHFKAVADSTKLPIMLYSVPGRSGIEIGVETTVRLADACENIVAIKEAGGSVDRVSQLADAVPEGFQILSGDDPLTLPFMSVGAVGVVSVCSNIIPKAMSDLVEAAANGDFEKARGIHAGYYPLFAGLMRLETNPVPIKTAVALMAKTTPNFRRPLANLDEAQLAELNALLNRYYLLENDAA